MLGIQVIAIVFGAFMLYITFLYFKRKDYSAVAFFMWLVFWIMLIALAVFPSLLDPFVEKILQLKRPLDFFIIIGFLVILFVCFITYNKVVKTEKKIEEVVRKIALMENGKKI